MTTNLPDPLDRIKPSLQNVRRYGSGLLAICPAHADINPSLSVSVGRDGRVLLHCFAGCTTEAVLQSLGLTMADLFGDGPRSTSGRFHAPPQPGLPTNRAKPPRVLDGPRRVVASFDYLNRMGDWCYAIDRLEGGATRKSFKMRPSGIKKEDRILYRLPALSDCDDPVVIPEGEGKADVLAEMGFTATACPFGASGWLPHYVDYLRRRDCVIWPDKDDVGMRFAEAVAHSLQGVAAKVRIVTPPDFLPEGGDVVDLVKAAAA